MKKKKALQEAETPQSALILKLSLIGFLRNKEAIGLSEKQRMTSDYSITTVVQPCLSSMVPYWIPRRVSYRCLEIGPGFSPKL